VSKQTPYSVQFNTHTHTHTHTHRHTHAYLPGLGFILNLVEKAKILYPMRLKKMEKLKSKLVSASYSTSLWLRGELVQTLGFGVAHWVPVSIQPFIISVILAESRSLGLSGSQSNRWLHPLHGATERDGMGWGNLPRACHVVQHLDRKLEPVTCAHYACGLRTGNAIETKVPRVPLIKQALEREEENLSTTISLIVLCLGTRGALVLWAEEISNLAWEQRLITDSQRMKISARKQGAHGSRGWERS
jgi:hypothetical protein